MSASRLDGTLTPSALRRPWHDSRQLQAQMVHFLRQLQAICQLEVIECSWQALMDFTDKREGDLDALIAAHRTYLDRVVRKILLLGSKRDKQVRIDLIGNDFG
jgi:gamma-tubulin complex component 3